MASSQHGSVSTMVPSMSQRTAAGRSGDPGRFSRSAPEREVPPGGPGCRLIIDSLRRPGQASDVTPVAPVGWSVPGGSFGPRVELPKGEHVSEESTVPELRDPLVIAAFEGWNDAGEAASGAIAHLERVWDAKPLVALDPENYHDFQVTRPVVSIEEDGTKRITWPTTRLLWARPEGSERDVLLIRGIEPSMRWRTFTAELLGYAAQHGATMLV